MPKVTYVEDDGTTHEIDVPVGTTLMQGAVSHLIPGIEGDCGGLCACATCHVYISDEFVPLCNSADELESGMLEFAFDVRDSSRLACQIEVSEEMEGIVVQMPLRQY
ncbi:MAG: 2Fe-2S iron-sulfur cluster binding domain-containing protein [Proteobacteria bacterium]|nr:2Fe-2S iron-sulfur cluster binding domain-containing protein [Pseudomonadota bacterium]